MFGSFDGKSGGGGGGGLRIKERVKGIEKGE